MRPQQPVRLALMLGCRHLENHHFEPSCRQMWLPGSAPSDLSCAMVHKVTLYRQTEPRDHQMPVLMILRLVTGFRRNGIAPATRLAVIFA
jgi:hypothetical protein